MTRSTALFTAAAAVFLVSPAIGETMVMSNSVSLNLDDFVAEGVTGMTAITVDPSDETMPDGTLYDVDSMVTLPEPAAELGLLFGLGALAFTADRILSRRKTA